MGKKRIYIEWAIILLYITVVGLVVLSSFVEKIYIEWSIPTISAKKLEK